MNRSEDKNMLPNFGDVDNNLSSKPKDYGPFLPRKQPNLKRNFGLQKILLFLLSITALILIIRLCYLFFADVERFPIQTVKVVATYQHITHQQLESILSNYIQDSFFSLSVKQLYQNLAALDWVQEVKIERIWPGNLKITLIEKMPIATWNDSLLTKDGIIFNNGGNKNEFLLPHLYGPTNQQMDVLQVFQKMSKILSIYGLKASALALRENQAWVLTLSNGFQVFLGKRDLMERVNRFCKAYPSVFADKLDQVVSVDLRYPRGMAVQWKNKREDDG